MSQGKIIRDWGQTDPQQFYAGMVENWPLYFDVEADTWVAYGYRFCRQLLLNDAAEIPPLPIDIRLNDRAALLIKNLARLNNNQQHIIAREAAHALYNTLQPVSAGEIIDTLIVNAEQADGVIDWVGAVCKKLPVLYLLKGLGFNDEASSYILPHMGQLVKIMSPQKTSGDIDQLNSIVNEFYTLAEHRLKHLLDLNKSDVSFDLYIANLIGLLIQSYDAGRGLLCNSLINVIAQNPGVNLANQDEQFFTRQIFEILRFDPPVHNTRRVASADIKIGGHTIRRGEKIMIVMAAANLDPEVFDAPLTYNPERANNTAHLTFGAGGHACLAKHLMVKMATDTFSALFARYPQVFIPKQEMTFEHQLNVRLIKQLIINIAESEPN